MGSAITRICVSFYFNNGRSSNFSVEGADMTVWEQDVYNRFGHHIDEGNLRHFLEEFNYFDYVYPSTEKVYTEVSQLGGLNNCNLITFEYRKTDPYGDGDAHYIVALKGEIHNSNKTSLTENSLDEDEFAFDENDTRECEGMLEIKYSNKVIESILEEYEYSRKEESNTLIRFWEDVPEYYGVEDIECLTRTLIASLIRTGSGLDGYQEALINAFDRIVNSFEFLEGTAEEQSDEDRSWGYDFKTENGQYCAKERECYGGW